MMTMGSAAVSSMARMTTEPEWRMTSRMPLVPFGSRSLSVKTEKSGPL